MIYKLVFIEMFYILRDCIPSLYENNIIFDIIETRNHLYFCIMMHFGSDFDR